MNSAGAQEATLRAEQARLLRAGIPAAATGNLLIATITAVVLWDQTPAIPLLVWFTVFVSIQLARVLLAWVSQRKVIAIDNPDLLGLLRFGALLSGAGWGVLPVFLYPGDFPHQLFLPFVIGGVTGAAVAALSIDRASALLFIVPALLPLIARLFVEAGEVTVAMGTMAALYLGYLTSAARRGEQAFRDTQALRVQADRQNAALREAQRLARLGSWSLDTASGRLVWSEEVQSIFGRDPAVAAPDLETYYRDLVHAEDVEAVQRTLQAAIRYPGQRQSVDHRIRLPDGALRWVCIEGLAAAEGTGPAERIVGTVQDITAHKQPELFAQSTLDALSSHIAILDAQGTIIAVNRAWREFARRNAGQPSATCEGSNYLAVCRTTFETDAESSARIHDGIRAVIDGRTDTFSAEYPCHSPDTQRWFNLRVTRFHGAPPASVVVAHDDITQRVLAERALHESDQRWQFALEGSGDGVWDWNAQTNKVFFSRRWKEMLGYNDAEIGDALDEWDSRVHPDDKAACYEDLNRHFRGETQVYINEHRVRCKDGSYKWILDRGRVIERTADGRPLRVIGTHTDITERKKAEQMKNEFISTVSHELRTPLTSIRGSLGLLAGGAVAGDADRTHQLIGIAHQNAERLSLLVNDILDVEKIASGKMKFDLRPQPLMPLIEQALTVNQAYAAQYGVSFRMAARIGQGTVNVDAERFQQVMANLLSNAAKFSPAGSQVDVSVAAAGDHFRISVRDRGPGIPPDFRARVFERFSQADATDTRRRGGTGLGLAITRHIVEKLGGRIGFETGESAGTVFHVDLPVWREPPAVLAAGQSAAG